MGEGGHEMDCVEVHCRSGPPRRDPPNAPHAPYSFRGLHHALCHAQLPLSAALNRSATRASRLGPLPLARLTHSAASSPPFVMLSFRCRPRSLARRRALRALARSRSPALLIPRPPPRPLSCSASVVGRAQSLGDAR